jgi:hypothetical protein
MHQEATVIHPPTLHNLFRLIDVEERLATGAPTGVACTRLSGTPAVL